MIAAPSKLRSPLKWHGGKSYLARRIIELIPPTSAFAEHYAGGMSIGLNLRPITFHLANDLNPDLIRFWRSLQGDGARDSIEAVRAIPYSEVSFIAAGDEPTTPLSFLVRNRMSRGGLGKTYAWSERLRGGRPGDLNAWETFKEELPVIVERLASIRLTCRDALESIREFDAEQGADAVHYCDPPYLASTRTERNAYAFEASVEHHAALLKTLKVVRGTVLLSGYRSEMYDDTLSGWAPPMEWRIANHSGQGREKQRRVECLWSNR